MTEAKPLFKAEIGEIQDSISGLEPDDTVITNEEVNCLIATIDAHDARIAEQDRRIRALESVLQELNAQVWGECPSLLNEDSGGDGRLAVEIDKVLKGAKDE